MNHHFLCFEETHLLQLQRRKKNQYLKIWNKGGGCGHFLPVAPTSVWCAYHVMQWKSVITFQMSSVLVRML